MNNNIASKLKSRLVATLTTEAAAAGAAAVSLGLVAVVLRLWRRHRFPQQQQQERQEEDEDETSEKATDMMVTVVLNELEHLLYKTGEQPVSTLAWFRGDYRDDDDVRTVLERRLKLILERNPWLVGQVRWNGRSSNKKNHQLVLEYPQSLSTSSSFNHYRHFVVLDEESSPISRDMPPDQLCVILCQQQQKRQEGDLILLRNGPDQPLFKVAIVPCRKNPTKHFALIVSLSHLVGDGATFYRLHGMLVSYDDKDDDDDPDVTPLSCQRIQSSAAQQADALGGNAEYSYFTSCGILTNFVVGVLRVLLFGPPPQQRWFVVDDSKMDKIKKQEADVAMRDGVPFVSTNDVLTSWFLQGTGCTHGGMNVNFRNRLDGHTNDHAGNYEAAIFYRNRHDSRTPGQIRASLANLRLASYPHRGMPGFWEHLTSSFALVTNWSSFSKKRKMILPGGGGGCEQELHIPLYDISSSTPYGFALMIIFRARPNEIGLFCSGQASLLRGLEKAPFLSEEPMV